MPTFRNRHGKWQARITRRGQQPIAKSSNNYLTAAYYCLQLLLMYEAVLI